MDLGLQGQTAVIVGGARGIGAAITAAFAAEGAQAAILDIVPDTEAAASDLASRTSARVIGMQVDAADLDSLRAAANRIDSAIGSWNHVVYAAGIGSGKVGFPFWNVDPADWDRVIRVNLMGAVNTAHLFAPPMAERGNGTILFLASVAGQIGSQTDPPYSAAKAAVINFAQCAARDLASSGVRVNTICPGMVQTDLNRSVWRAWNEKQAEADQMTYEEWGQDKVRRVSPLGRWQQPEEIATMAVYLASDHARNITGQTLNVDGGQVMHA